MKENKSVLLRPNASIFIPTVSNSCRYHLRKLYTNHANLAYLTFLNNADTNPIILDSIGKIKKQKQTNKQTHSHPPTQKRTPDKAKHKTKNKQEEEWRTFNGISVFVQR